MATDFQIQYDAVKDWNEDGWELESAVDQDLFKQDNGFEY